MKKFSDIFSWTYKDLKTYYISIIQHIIPLKNNSNPFKQKLRHVNHVLLPVIEKEVKKLLEANIIVPLINSDWIANVIPMGKKIGEIRLFVYFRNRNRCSLKDNYPLPKMDQILQRVMGSHRIPMIDGFFGYSQVLIHE